MKQQNVNCTGAIYTLGQPCTGAIYTLGQPCTGAIYTPGNNQTLTEFLLLGFGDLHGFCSWFFIMCLMVYALTIFGNMIIIIIVSTSHLVESPMYFFLCFLSLSDIVLTTNIVPHLLHIVIKEQVTVSFIGCITQFQMFGSSTGTECLLLTVMSYDRYLAICNPLCYTSIMGAQVKHYLVICSWILAFAITLTISVLVGGLHFCGPNVIDHFFCDFGPLIKLSCSDTYLLKIIDFVVTIPVTIFPFVFIILSYLSIFIAIHRIPSTYGRLKAFSTCSSHLTVVCTFYLSLITIYIIPAAGHSVIAQKILSFLYTVVTPLLNPLIYSLRNQEIRLVLKKMVCKLWNQE
ncbi:olfactory receptor 11A1-like [Bombina bombina]|uniref:olfactory receptor 11A1-like n=1 Tax=Bombina bombina TaxID=8345 RepID=UPI00235B167E|nr:olfactory receptor 11A1-like [Bombina bombina]